MCKKVSFILFFMAATVVCISGCEEQEASNPLSMENEKPQPTITETPATIPEPKPTITETKPTITQPQPVPSTQDQQPPEPTQQTKPKAKSKLDILAGVERLREMQKKSAETMRARASKKTADPNSTENKTE